MKIPIFLVFYNTTFSILVIVLLGLLLISPADIIYQSIQDQQLSNGIIVAAAYLLTGLIAGFIYATRLYATRTHLAALPRPSNVPETLAGTPGRRVIAQALARAAAIAYAAHPRDLIAVTTLHAGKAPPPPPELLPRGTGGSSEPLDRRRQQIKPAFGTIQHAGWTAPSTPDLPGVQFAPVILELPHLLEAKAVSLAPPDPLTAPALSSSSAPQEALLPDPLAVALLQRPAAMDIRAYVAHLTSLGTIGNPDAAAAFVEQYESARFGGKALTEEPFRRLMACFALLLRSLRAPKIEALRDFALSASSSTTDRTGRSSPSSARSIPASIRSDPSWRHLRREPRPPLPKRGATTGAAAQVLQRLERSEPSERAPLALSAIRHPIPQPGKSTLLPSPLDDGSLAVPNPLPATPTPHATPFFTPYRTSLSSNDGDRSAGSSSEADVSSRGSGTNEGDDSTEPRIHHTTSESRSQRREQPRRRHPRHRSRLLSRSTHSSTARIRPDGLGLRGRDGIDRSRASLSSGSDAYLSFAAGDGEDEGDDDDAGSVIRRAVTAQEMAPGSGSDAGSVVIRPEDHGVGGLLPVLVPVDAALAGGGVGEEQSPRLLHVDRGTSRRGSVEVRMGDVG